MKKLIVLIGVLASFSSAAENVKIKSIQTSNEGQYVRVTIVTEPMCPTFPMFSAVPKKISSKALIYKIKIDGLDSCQEELIEQQYILGVGMNELQENGVDPDGSIYVPIN